MSDVFVAGVVVEGRPCVVLGEGEGQEKAIRLLEAGANVTVVSETVCESVATAGRAGTLTWHPRAPTLTDTDGAFLVVSTVRDEDWSAALFKRATATSRGFLLCCIDQPAYCTFTQVATVRRGALQIAVATSGEAPMLAGRIRAAMEAQLGGDLAAFVARLGTLRAETPAAERRARIAEALEGFAWEVRYRVP